MLFRRKKPDAAPVFRYTAEDGRLTIRLERGGQALPFEQWAAARPDAAVAIARLTAAEDARGADGQPLAELSAETARLAPALVAGLDAADAAALDLPPPTPLALDIRAVGRPDEDGFHLTTRWVRPGGSPVRATADGALLTADGRIARIPEPLWSLNEAARALAAPLPQAERFQALAALRRHWPEEAGPGLHKDSFLDQLRIHYAAALSLKLNALTPGRTDFDPVLFAPGAVPDEEADGRLADEAQDALLSPAAQKLFATDRFRRETAARPAYVLRDGEYVFIDPALRPVLSAMRELQDRPEAERRAFVLNPRRTLRERLGEAVSAAIDLDGRFVETEQFSERVAGVDVWRAPVLPWLLPSAKNQWLPEFGLRVGSALHPVKPENADPLADRIEAALAEGRPEVAVAGFLEPAADGTAAPATIAPNAEAAAAMRAMSARAEHAAGARAEAAAAEWDPAQGKLFLTVRENFEDVAYEARRPASVSGSAAVEFPARLKTTLKPHQLTGLRWLAVVARSGRPGALLADDMGLGKTLQAIAFMAWLQDEAAAGRAARAPFLIVAPTGLLGNWRDEIAKHLAEPRLGPFLPAFGGDLKRLREDSGLSAREIDTGRAALDAGTFRDAGVVLTTYETMRDYHFSFARVRFGLIVFDEAQKLKNPAAQTTRAAAALNAELRLAMTGTPVENRLADLWSILDVVVPGLLGSARAFEKRYGGQEPDALAELRARLEQPDGALPPLMLRRMKADVLDALPPKRVHRHVIAMPPAQAHAYGGLVAQTAAARAGGTLGKGGMLTALAQMRGVSLHPRDPDSAGDLAAYADGSARLAKTMAVLEDVAAARERVLVFVEDLAMQDRLAAMVQQRFELPRPPSRINGRVPGPKRQALVDAFQAEAGRFGVMILSPRAGGTGLTLTAANHVIHLSRWWNPAVEDQATDRVYRIGQSRPVHVHLPLAVHPDSALAPSSFDLRLDALIERKRQLTRDFLLPADASERELETLLGEVTGEPFAAEAARAEQPAEGAPLVAGDAAVLAGKASRPTLKIPNRPEPAPKFWSVAPGRPRPVGEVLAPFAGRTVLSVRIEDPYALGSEASRRAQIAFLSQLRQVAASVERARLIYAPEVDGDYGDEQGCRLAFSRLRQSTLPDVPVDLIRRSKKARDDDFHDRKTEIEVRGAGGGTATHALHIGRGLEALFQNDRQCTITYVPPFAPT